MLEVLQVVRRGELPQPAVPAVASAFRGGELGVQVPVALCRGSRGRTLSRSLFEVPGVFKGAVGLWFCGSVVLGKTDLRYHV